MDRGGPQNNSRGPGSELSPTTPRHSGGTRGEGQLGSSTLSQPGHMVAGRDIRIYPEALALLNKCSPRMGTAVVAVSLSTESPAPCPIGDRAKMEPIKTQAETTRTLTEPKSAMEAQRMKESFPNGRRGGSREVTP